MIKFIWYIEMYRWRSKAEKTRINKEFCEKATKNGEDVRKIAYVKSGQREKRGK
jgi:hypothetical protein